VIERAERSPDATCTAYAIIRDVADRTDGTLRLGTGTLYTALARLETLERVEESDRRPSAAKDDERRR
jgi:DNA-binding PadR family transcriptional regulator